MIDVHSHILPGIDDGADATALLQGQVFEAAQLGQIAFMPQGLFHGGDFGLEPPL